MAQGGNASLGGDKTFTASGTITEFMAITAAGAEAGAGTVSIGIAQHDAVTGELVRTRQAGVSEIVANGSITAGDLLTPAGTGQIKTASSSDIVIGVAQESTSSTGDIISMRVTVGGHTVV